MKFLKLLFLLPMFVFASASVAVTQEFSDQEDGVYTDQVSNLDIESLKLASLRGSGSGRIFSRKWLPFEATMTCDKFPRVCRGKGSRGRDCCRKKCVNVKRDRNNCGRCGKKCKYSEICCKGKCVNLMFDRKNCGGCNNKCNRGGLCVYGMCGYA